MTTEPLTLNEYQAFTKTTAFYPNAGKKNIEELLYCTVGLSSETGELANFVKKLCRDGDTAELREKVKLELGDILWYAARLAEALDTTLQATMEYNHSKLLDRQQRDVLSGSGDFR